MIRIDRGAEPAALGKIRTQELKVLRGLGREPGAKDISGRYRDVSEILCSAQHYKCCYCESRVCVSFNDVEHYRPKGSATRLPGCDLKHGYWWLAFTWDNLMFACPSCNRSAKNDLFPIARTSLSLAAETMPPGAELPLLIDPSGQINPVAHIQFVQESDVSCGDDCWVAQPRDDSELGSYTIYVCDLNRKDLVERRRHHMRTVVRPQILALIRAIKKKDSEDINYQLDRALCMISNACEFVAFTFDAFRQLVADRSIFDIVGRGWPDPQDVAIPQKYT